MKNKKDIKDQKTLGERLYNEDNNDPKVVDEYCDYMASVWY